MSKIPKTWSACKKWSETKSGKKRLRELKDYNLVGKSYITEIERSKSNNSRCHGCGKIIGKNTLRGIQTKVWNVKKPFTMRFVYCSDCTIKLLDTTLDDIRKLRKFMKNKIRTRAISYKKQKELQIKDELLNKLEDEKNG